MSSRPSTNGLSQARNALGWCWQQHYGPTGDLRNCQVGVFLSLVTAMGHMLIDRELYVQADWIDDQGRC